MGKNRQKKKPSRKRHAAKTPKKRSAKALKKSSKTPRKRSTKKVRRVPQPYEAPLEIFVQLRPRKKTKVISTSPHHDLPHSYNKTKLELLERDPHWAYAFWDFSAETWKWLEDLRGKQITRAILRIRNFSTKQSHDVDVQLGTKHWYLHLDSPDTEFEAELGLMDGAGKFYLIARSNRIRMPRNGPSKNVDPKWKPTHFEELYKLSGGGTSEKASGLFSHFKKISS